MNLTGWAWEGTKSATEIMALKGRNLIDFRGYIILSRRSTDFMHGILYI